MDDTTKKSEKDEISEEKLMDLLISYFQEDRKERLFYIKSRDNLLKLHLLSQMVILALAMGVSVAGVGASKPIPNIVWISMPSSIIFFIMYSIDNRCIQVLTERIVKIWEEITKKNESSVHSSVFSTLSSLASAFDLALKQVGENYYNLTGSPSVQDIDVNKFEKMKISQTKIVYIILWLISYVVIPFLIPVLFYSEIRNQGLIWLYTIFAIIFFSIMSFLIYFECNLLIIKKTKTDKKDKINEKNK